MTDNLNEKYSNKIIEIESTINEQKKMKSEQLLIEQVISLYFHIKINNFCLFLILRIK